MRGADDPEETAAESERAGSSAVRLRRYASRPDQLGGGTQGCVLRDAVSRGSHQTASVLNMPASELGAHAEDRDPKNSRTK